jgi:hypothetical protein
MNEPKSPQSEADEERERVLQQGFVMDDAPIDEALESLEGKEEREPKNDDDRTGDR